MNKKKLEKSRNNWKNKAVTRGNELRYLRKENKRVKKERDQYKKELSELREQSKEREDKKLSVNNKEFLVYISLQLFLITRISFHAVSRVLKVIGGHLGFTKTPSPQTIINWVIRLSISRIKNSYQLIDQQIVDRKISTNKFICVIDTSIGLGVGKILAVLFVDAKHYILNKCCPTLQNVNCVAVSVANTWTGETIASVLEKVISVMGKPLSYLKDEGKDLEKAVKLLGERGYRSPSIGDVSHKVANLLKHEYQKNPLFEKFLSVCGKISGKFKQSILACLVPPKVSNKARFMNIHRLIKWASKLLKHLPKDRVKKGSVLSKLREILEKMPEYKLFISHFHRDASVLLSCQEVLKTKGLNKDSYMDCLKFVEKIPRGSSVRIGFIDWLDKQFLIAKELALEEGMPVNSDIIESLFGVAKQHGTGEVKDANRIALRIPALCGELTLKEVQNVLRITVEEQKRIVESLPSLIKQRRDILENPGSLEKVLSDNTKRNLELIPDIQKRLNIDVVKDCNDLNSTFIDLNTHTILPIESEILETAA